MYGAGGPAFRVSLGGFCFTVHSDGLPLFPETDGSYREFFLDPAAANGGEAVDVCVSIAHIRYPGWRHLFDGGSWGIFARDGERSLIFRPPTLPDPVCEVRFRPGAPEVELVCAPSLMESREGVAGIVNQFRYPLDQVLTMYLLGARGLILHAAGFVFRGRGVALPGVSGAGKSTITRLASGCSGFRVLSDDRVILRTQGDSGVIHGTPWPGEAGVAERLEAPAVQLLFLEKGDTNDVRTISFREALARLLPTASLPWFDAEYLENGLRACDSIICAIPAAVFTFRDEAHAVKVLENYVADL